jgi:hypothetical protein
MCHTNGPRAIRPDFSDAVPAAARISAWDRVRLLAWNSRIKTYGRVPSAEGQPPSHDAASAPFRQLSAADNRRLNVATCLKCHNENWWGRGSLTVQNAPTIEHMVDNGLMPPPGFSLPEAERKQVQRFVDGFPDS